MKQISSNSQNLARTQNELRIIEFLFRHFDENLSINSLASAFELSPPGTMKILKKLRNQKILVSQRKGLADFYKLNLALDATINLLKYLLESADIKKQTVPYVNELAALKPCAKMCILFGSILSDSKTAKDVDIIIVIDKDDFGSAHKIIRSIENHLGKKVHAVMQTEDELRDNLKKKDSVILSAIKAGIFLWGSEYMLRGMKLE